MIKTIPLVQASLKGFIRDWKSILLLIVFPLLLISIVFISFNPEGIKKIPVGFIGSQQGFDIDEYKDTYFSYLITTKYDDLDSCIRDLKIHKQYVCLHALLEDAIILNVYYDNTREPVIWEIIERIKSTVDYIQKEKSKQMASAFLDKMITNVDKIDVFKKNLIDTNSRIGSYISDTENAINSLNSAKQEMSNVIYSMDSDISSVKSTKFDLKRQKDDMFTSSINSLSNSDNSASLIKTLVYPESAYLAIIRSDTASLRSRIISYSNIAEANFVNLDNKIKGYEDNSLRGKNYVYEIDSAITGLKSKKKDMVSYQSRLEDAVGELSEIQAKFKDIENIDTETLVNPIVIRNTPTYTPPLSEEASLNETKANQINKLVKGVSLISLQTIFPTMLLLITLFLSLLISSYICLNDVNSSANKRIKLIKGIFIHEVISIYLSSLIIMAVPILCILLVGKILFGIPIFEHFNIILLLLFILSSIFIFVGITLAYLIKKDSITLLISAFLLVFLIFFSGFLLPIERMSRISGLLAENFPTKIALSAFDKIVFYNQDPSSIYGDITTLLIWIASLVVVVLITKKIRNA